MKIEETLGKMEIGMVAGNMTVTGNLATGHMKIGDMVVILKILSRMKDLVDENH